MRYFASRSEASLRHRPKIDRERRLKDDDETWCHGELHECECWIIRAAFAWLRIALGLHRMTSAANRTARLAAVQMRARWVGWGDYHRLLLSVMVI